MILFVIVPFRVFFCSSVRIVLSVTSFSKPCNVVIAVCSAFTSLLFSILGFCPFASATFNGVTIALILSLYSLNVASCASFSFLSL